MLDLTDELRISNETPDTIAARLIADTNAGIDPSDPAYADTIFGGIWDDLNRSAGLEFDRIYDRFNEVAAAAIPALSFGAFLDAWAVSLGLNRKDAAFAGGTIQFTGAEDTVIPVGTQVSTAQTSDQEDPVAYVTTAGGTIDGTGVILLAAVATTAGSEGNVPANTVTILDTPLTGVSVTNPAAMTGGADVETDQALQVRVIRKLTGAGGGGNADDYVNWALNYPGVGFVTVQPNTPSLGHVTVVVTDINNDPVPSPVTDGLQAQLDPSGSASQGAGLAPIGATVIVATPTSLDITVDAEVTLSAGFTLDGSAGTRAVRGPVQASLARYTNTLPVGGDVIRNKVIAAIVDVLGVVDVDETTLDLNGSTTLDVAVSATQVASLTIPIALAES